MADKHRIGIREGILDPEHVEAMGEAVWLFMWYVARQTDATGRVLGDGVLTWKRIGVRLGRPRRTLQRWQGKLLDGNYIRVRTEARGFRVRVCHQKKFDSKWKPAK